ncbi:SH3 domain-containing protein [Streptomyces syringium]|uniref:SH3 domain-containing protein n=1 Tax=Streptomyces syringium TaxID=76729 RepID=UPI0037D6B561
MSIRRKVGTALATAVVALSGAVAMAPTASAAGGPGREACDGRSFDRVESVRTDSGVNLRTGPGTGYESRGLLYDGTRIYVGCFSNRGYAYVQVYSGGHSGQYGWVATSYITGLYNM